MCKSLPRFFSHCRSTKPQQAVSSQAPSAPRPKALRHKKCPPAQTKADRNRQISDFLAARAFMRGVAQRIIHLCAEAVLGQRPRSQEAAPAQFRLVPLLYSLTKSACAASAFSKGQISPCCRGCSSRGFKRLSMMIASRPIRHWNTKEITLTDGLDLSDIIGRMDHIVPMGGQNHR